MQKTKQYLFRMKECVPGFINLLKTIIGSGILYIPMMFKTFGVVPTFFLMFISCIFSVTGQLIYTYCNFNLNDRSSNLTSLSNKSIPNISILVDFFVFFKCFGVSTSYLIIIRELLPNLLSHIFGPSIISDPKISLLIFLSFIGPITFFRELKSLKYTSLLGIMAIMTILIASIMIYLSTPHNILKIKTYEPISIDAFGALGTFVFAFTCHQNLISVQNELLKNEPKNVKKIIYSTALASFIIYMLFGYINYSIFNDNMYDNILKSYPNTKYTLFLHFLYTIVMGFSYPLQINPSRTYLLNLLRVSPEGKKNNFIHCIFTIILLLSTYSLTITGLKLGEIYSFIGSTASTMICLVFPVLIYYYMNIPKRTILLVLGMACLLVGIGVFTISLFHLIYRH